MYLNLHRYSLFLFTGVALGVGSASAQDGPLVAPGASLTTLADGFELLEGPAADSEGSVYFSDVLGDKVYRWTDGEGLSIFRDGLGNPNGLFFDAEDNLFVCEWGNRRITRISPDGQLTLVADQFDGKRLNSPNDLWVDPDGGVYFSDPLLRPNEGIELDGNYVFYAPGDGSPVQRVIADLEAPNGVLGTADGMRLYVADEGPRDMGSKTTYVYDIQPDGSLADRRVAAAEGSDGLTLDERGNLYLTTAEGVAIYSQDGREIETIPLQRPSNVTFGGPDRRTLFITGSKEFYSIRMNVRGQ